MTELSSIQDEVLRRIGRNLLLFQEIEHILKFLLAHHQGEGSAESYEISRQKQVNCVGSKTLGELVKKFGNDVLQDAGEDVPEEERAAGWFSFSFKQSGDSVFVESMRRDFKLMTDERNNLVHHFLPRWQPESSQKLEEALTYLDTQREKVLPTHVHLKSTVTGMQEGRRLLLEFMASPEYERQSELMWLQASPLVSLLRAVAAGCRREDGWVYLDQAGSVASEEMPEEMKSLSERYGCKTLKKLLLDCEMFDVFDEQLQNGRFRTKYRVKSLS